MKTDMMDRESYLESILYAIDVLNGYRLELKDFRAQIGKKALSAKEIETKNYLFQVKYTELIEPVMDQFYFFKTKLKDKQIGTDITEKLIELNKHVELVDLGLSDLRISLEGMMVDNPSVFYRPMAPDPKAIESSPMFS